MPHQRARVLTGTTTVLLLLICGYRSAAEPERTWVNDRVSLHKWWYGRDHGAVSPQLVSRLERHVASSPNDAEAIFYLSRVRLLGVAGYVPDPAKGLELLRKAAKLGHPAAKARFGFMLATGEGVATDENEGVRLLNEAIEEDEPDAYLYRGILRGELYRDGTLDPQARAEARQDFEEAADKGEVRSHFYLYMLEDDPSVALSRLKEGTEAGDPQAQFFLGYVHWKGELGLQIDKQEGLKWVRQAVESENPYYQGALGRMYLEPGPTQDKAEAKKWLKLALARNDPDTLHLIAMWDLSGELGETNIERGLAYLKAAADQSHTESEFVLGRLYTEGLLVERDLSKAKDLFKRAAAKGRKEAAIYLEWMKSGVGVTSP